LPEAGELVQAVLPEISGKKNNTDGVSMDQVIITKAEYDELTEEVTRSRKQLLQYAEIIHRLVKEKEDLQYKLSLRSNT
jgi:hypothetical protein